MKVADYAMDQPGVIGYICTDQEGLCVAAKGQVNQNLSGPIHQLAKLASRIEEISRPNKSDKTEPPVIRVDMQKFKFTMQSRDSITTAIISQQK